MLYIEEKTQIRQFELLEFFSKKDEYRVIFWFYPESNLTSLNELKITNNLDFSPVTTYDDFKPYGTQSVALDGKLINFIYANANLILENIDSISLYKENDKDWKVCTIGHEGMCLVQSESYQEELEALGFNISLNPPSWW